MIGNVKAVLGEEPWLWPFPFAPPEGEGLSFLTEEVPLMSADVEGGHRRAVAKAEPESEPRRRSARPQTSGGTGSAPATPGHSEDDFSSGEDHSATQTDTTEGER